MNPQDYIFFRKHAAQLEGKTLDTIAHRYSYKEAREILAAGVRGSVEKSILKLCKGKEIRTKWGVWWAELKIKE